jgi:CheY-like chemotaxis protein
VRPDHGPDGRVPCAPDRASPGRARPKDHVVVSVKSYKPDIARATELGADAYLVKPITPDGWRRSIAGAGLEWRESCA